MPTSRSIRSSWLPILAVCIACVMPTIARAYNCPPGYVSRREIEWADGAHGVVAVGAAARMLVHSGDCKNRFVVPAARVAIFVSRAASGPYERAQVRASGYGISFTPLAPGLYFLKVATGDDPTIESADPGAIVVAYDASSRQTVRVTDSRREPVPRALSIALRPVLAEPTTEPFLVPYIVARRRGAERRAVVPSGTYELVEVLVTPFVSDDRTPRRGSHVVVSSRSTPRAVEITGSGQIVLDDERARFTP